MHLLLPFLLLLPTLAQYSPLELLGEQVSIEYNGVDFEAIIHFENGTDYSFILCFAGTTVEETTDEDDVVRCPLTIE